MRGRHQFQRLLSRRRIQNGEFFDGGLPSPIAKFLQDEFRIRLVVNAADVVGSGGQLLHPRAQLRGGQIGVEALFEPLLFGRGPGRETQQRARAAAWLRGRDQCRKRSGQQCAAAAHRSLQHCSVPQSRIPVPRFNRVTATANIEATAPIMIPYATRRSTSVVPRKP